MDVNLIDLFIMKYQRRIRYERLKYLESDIVESTRTLIRSSNGNIRNHLKKIYYHTRPAIDNIKIYSKVLELLQSETCNITLDLMFQCLFELMKSRFDYNKGIVYREDFKDIINADALWDNLIESRMIKEIDDFIAVPYDNLNYDALRFILYDYNVDEKFINRFDVSFDIIEFLKLRPRKPYNEVDELIIAFRKNINRVKKNLFMIEEMNSKAPLGVTFY